MNKSRLNQLTRNFVKKYPHAWINKFDDDATLTNAEEGMLMKIFDEMLDQVDDLSKNDPIIQKAMDLVLANQDFDKKALGIFINCARKFSVGKDFNGLLKTYYVNAVQQS